MLFNSYAFILVFLPIVWLGYRWLAEREDSGRAMTVWLTAASLVFYGYWDVRFVPLILLSMIVNYLIGLTIDRGGGRCKAWLCLGIGFNLGLLGYFEYANFFVATLETIDLAPRPAPQPGPSPRPARSCCICSPSSPWSGCCRIPPRSWRGQSARCRPRAIRRSSGC